MAARKRHGQPHGLVLTVSGQIHGSIRKNQHDKNVSLNSAINNAIANDLTGEARRTSEETLLVVKPARSFHCNKGPFTLSALKIRLILDDYWWRLKVTFSWPFISLNQVIFSRASSTFTSGIAKDIHSKFSYCIFSLCINLILHEVVNYTNFGVFNTGLMSSSSSSGFSSDSPGRFSPDTARTLCAESGRILSLGMGNRVR